jgi:predicted transposase/invertase (TIGR01784 family)
MVIQKGGAPMTRLKYTFTNDVLFKMLFVKHQDLLKKLVSDLLGISVGSIGKFEIRNPEIPPEELGSKFCRLDINMEVDGQRVDLEIQVSDEGDYPERSLYYWARDYSAALGRGKNYSKLPRTIVISILDFKLFECEDAHSEYQALEVTRHTRLTDRLSLHYYELPKLPESIDAKDSLGQWLALFNAKSEEDLKRIMSLEVKEMDQAIKAYEDITATEEFKYRARLRFEAQCNEESALANAWEQATRANDAKWQCIVADMQAEIAQLRALFDNKK